MGHHPYASTGFSLAMVSFMLSQFNQKYLDARNEERFQPLPELSSESSRPTPEEVETYDRIDSQDWYLRDQRYYWYSTLPSLPYNQFLCQVAREEERLEAQKATGQRQVLPYDESLNLQRNAQNNVRARWVTQGIWGAEWGPPWPKGVGNRRYSAMNPETMSWRGRAEPPDHPFKYLPDPRQPYPNSWGHEESWGIDEERLDKDEDDVEDGNIDSPVSFVSTEMPALGPPGMLVPHVEKPEASLPVAQFVSQNAHERAWIRGCDETLDELRVHAMARESVRQNWKRDCIWRPQWDRKGIPSGHWPHEFPRRKRRDEEKDESAGKTKVGESSSHKHHKRRRVI